MGLRDMHDDIFNMCPVTDFAINTPKSFEKRDDDNECGWLLKKVIFQSRLGHDLCSI